MNELQATMNRLSKEVSEYDDAYRIIDGVMARHFENLGKTDNNDYRDLKELREKIRIKAERARSVYERFLDEHGTDPRLSE